MEELSHCRLKCCCLGDIWIQRKNDLVDVVVEKGIIHTTMRPHRIEASALNLFGTSESPCDGRKTVKPLQAHLEVVLKLGTRIENVYWRLGFTCCVSCVYPGDAATWFDSTFAATLKQTVMIHHGLWASSIARD